MPKHYQLPEEKTQDKMYQVHFWNSGWFLNELGPCFLSATRGQAFPVCVCVFTKVSLSVLEWQADGNKHCLSWVQCKHRQCMGHCVRQRRMNDPLTLQTLPAVQSEVCMSVCECASVHALVLVHSCGQIQIWGHTISQCSLFNFHRYVNSIAKACIWCIRKVYSKGEES